MVQSEGEQCRGESGGELAAPRPVPSLPRPLDPAGRWLAGKAPRRPWLMAPVSGRQVAMPPGAEGCGPQTSLGQPLPPAQWRLPGHCSLRSSSAPPRTRVHARLTASQSWASSIGFMSLFDENGESAGGRRAARVAARRVTRHIWCSSGGGQVPSPPNPPPPSESGPVPLNQASVLHL